MRVFVDANIIVSVLNKEYPLYTYTSRILSLADTSRFRLYTSPVCLAIAFYFAEKRTNAAIAKQKLTVLCRHIKIAEATTATVQQALANKAVLDFEDGLQCYSALQSKCVCIVTDDVNDYYFSQTEVLSSEAFVTKYMCNS